MVNKEQMGEQTPESKESFREKRIEEGKNIIRNYETAENLEKTIKRLKENREELVADGKTNEWADEYIEILESVLQEKKE